MLLASACFDNSPFGAKDFFTDAPSAPLVEEEDLFFGFAALMSSAGVTASFLVLLDWEDLEASEIEMREREIS